MPEDIGHDEDLSVERKAAEMSFRKAREAAERGHMDEAVEHVKDALSHDPTHVDVRRWLAELWEESGQLARASREYQEIIHVNRDDEQAWEALGRVDAAGAERLERLHDIAPDPFVAPRQSTSDDMFADMGAEEDEEDEYAEESVGEEGANTADVVDDWEDVGDSASAEVEVVEPIPDNQQAEEPVPWAFEQDYDFRRRLLARPGIDAMVEKLHDMAGDYDAWETALVGCAHLDRDRHAHEHEIIGEVVKLFNLPPLEMFFAPERRMIPTIIGGDPVMVAFTAGMMHALPGSALQFAIGRTIAHLALGALLCRQVAIVILQRSPTSQTDVEEALTDLLVQKTLGWDVGVSRDEMVMTRKLAHAWEQRVALSADRGGLLASGDLDAACLAIARGTARDSDRAAALKLEAFMAEYEGQDPRQLAAIDLKECPLRSGPYGAYRILMLRWWARSEQYKLLAETSGP